MILPATLLGIACFIGPADEARRAELRDAYRAALRGTIEKRYQAEGKRRRDHERRRAILIEAQREAMRRQIPSESRRERRCPECDRVNCRFH